MVLKRERVSPPNPADEAGQAILAGEAGQAFVEYVLLLGIVAFVLLTTFQWFDRIGFAEKLSSPLSDQYAKIYKYGHPKAKGPDEGDAENHPALPMGNNRFFINPK